MSEASVTSRPERAGRQPLPDRLQALIQRIATGPRMSKDLAREEARDGLREILEGRAHPVRAGVFLVALRMKRETDEENLGLLDALRESMVTATAEVPALLDLSDPYDGYTRSLPCTSFLPAVLSACGLPALCHGVEALAPKLGLGHARVLRAAGVETGLHPVQAARRIADPRIGWSYVDQSRFCPPLHALTELRRLIVKRPSLSTLERVLGPVRARGPTHLVVGYVHRDYPRVYSLLAHAVGFASALVVRGVEGGPVPALRESGQAWRSQAGSEPERVGLDPVDLGLESAVRAATVPELAVDGDDPLGRAAAETGRAALAGAPGPMRDALVYGAALCLWHAGCVESPARGARRAREALDGGLARDRFEAARG